MKRFLPLRAPAWLFTVSYWLIFPVFFALMLLYVWPTLAESFTILALTLVALLILTPTDYRLAVLTFVAGSALGYFLELWGTTRQCWMYYTLETPPLFAVLAHGMAAVAFWRTVLLLQLFVNKWARYKPGCGSRGLRTNRKNLRSKLPQSKPES